MWYQKDLASGRPGGCPSAVADAELAVDVLEVEVHCLGGDEEPCRYFIVAQTLGQQLEDLYVVRTFWTDCGLI
jgi:hypothetical protein